MGAGMVRESLMGRHITRFTQLPGAFMKVQLSSWTKKEGTIAEAIESRVVTSSATKH